MESKRLAWLVPVGSAIAAVLAALAANGKAALDALGGVPMLLQAWASGLPLGIWSFMLSLVLALLVWAKAITKLPPTASGRARHFSSDNLAIVTALTVTVSQQAIVGIGQGKLLSAIWIGLIAGFLAPWIGRAIRAMFSPKAPTAEPPGPAP